MALLGEVIEAKNSTRRKHLNRIFYGLEKVKRKPRRRKFNLVSVSSGQMASCFIEMLGAYKRMQGKVDTSSMTFEEKVIFLFEYYEDNEKIDQLYELNKAIIKGQNIKLINSVKEEVKHMALGKYSRVLLYHVNR